ncbi:hypothetical protein D3C77_684170 [compost metagenome]
MRLPAFHVVAVNLFVADGFAIPGFDRAVGATGAHRQQRDFVVEADEAFNNGPATAHPPAFLSVAPRLRHVIGAFDHGLALAGR